MRSAYLVRPSVSSDAERMVAVWRSTWAATYASTLGFEAVKAMIREIDRRGTSSLIPRGALGLCLIHNGNVVGTAVHSDDRPTVYLWGKYILPRHQRSGAGALLLRAVRGVAGKRPIEVHVLESSVQAIGFYRKHGFRTLDLAETEIMPGIVRTCRVMRQTTG